MRLLNWSRLALLLMCGSLVFAATSQAASITWVGGTGDLADAANWGGVVPGTADVAIFNGTSVVNPSTGNLSVRYIEFDAGAPAYNFTGSGTITIASNGNIDTYTATTTQTFSNSSIVLNGAAGLFASSSGGSAPLVLNVGTLTMGTGTVNASLAPITINAGTLTKTSGTFNANGGTITVTPSVSVSSSITANGPQNIYFNGGISGAGNVVKTGLGTLYLGSSGTWGGNFTLGTTSNPDAGNVEIATADAFGAGGSLAAGYVDILSKTGAVVINNAGVPMALSDVVYARGRASDSASQMINAAGVNTFNGTFITETAGLGGNYIIESNAGALVFSPTSQITQNVASAQTLNLNGSGSGNEIQSALIQNSATKIWNVAKNGSGNWTISGNQTYTGTTTVNGGKLLINGTHVGGGGYSVASGATLGGTGSVSAAVVVNGVLAPGLAIESLATGAATLATTATFAYDLNSAALNGDLLIANGSLSIASGAALSLAEVASGTLTAGAKLALINYSGAWDGGTFAGYADDSTFTLGSNTWQINYNDTTGGSNFTSDYIAGNFVTLTVVPEPRAIVLGVMGLLGLACFRRQS